MDERLATEDRGVAILARAMVWFTLIGSATVAVAFAAHLH
jgi:hypothetical protein